MKIAMLKTRFFICGEKYYKTRKKPGQLCHKPENFFIAQTSGIVLFALPKKNKTMGDVKNLSGKEAVEKMREIADATNTCMFCTEAESLPFPTRPMATQKVDDDGNFWFLSSKTSNKDHEVKENSKVQLIYARPDKYEFLSVYGTASSFYDREKIHEMWTPIAKTWFPEGKDDPNLSVIKVTPQDAYYWDTKDGKLISLIKIAAGAVVGKMDDGGIEGQAKA